MANVPTHRCDTTPNTAGARGIALSYLRKFVQQCNLGKLNTATGVYTIGDGLFAYCTKCYNLENVEILSRDSLISRLRRTRRVVEDVIENFNVCIFVYPTDRLEYGGYHCHLTMEGHTPIKLERVKYLNAMGRLPASNHFMTKYAGVGSSFSIHSWYRNYVDSWHISADLVLAVGPPTADYPTRKDYLYISQVDYTQSPEVVTLLCELPIGYLMPYNEYNHAGFYSTAINFNGTKFSYSIMEYMFTQTIVKTEQVQGVLYYWIYREVTCHAFVKTITFTYNEQLKTITGYSVHTDVDATAVTYYTVKTQLAYLDSSARVDVDYPYQYSELLYFQIMYEGMTDKLLYYGARYGTSTISSGMDVFEPFTNTIESPFVSTFMDINGYPQLYAPDDNLSRFLGTAYTYLNNETRSALFINYIDTGIQLDNPSRVSMCYDPITDNVFVSIQNARTLTYEYITRLYVYKRNVAGIVDITSQIEALTFKYKDQTTGELVETRPNLSYGWELHIYPNLDAVTKVERTVVI